MGRQGQGGRGGLVGEDPSRGFGHTRSEERHEEDLKAGEPDLFKVFHAKYFLQFYVRPQEGEKSTEVMQLVGSIDVFELNIDS